MQELGNFDQVHSYLSGLMPETRSRREAYTLDNMRTLMNFLGNPQDSYKAIHVAGTSGKTSTCYYLTAMLKAAGKKVGTIISPHLDEVNERVQINGKPLDEQKFCKELSQFIHEIEPSGVKPTYFELLVAFAYWEFARQKIDYTVVEVGLGGLLDGTNVINRSDKICVIADIGFDHTTTLGNTLAAIAGQKAGIILSGNTVFSYKQSDEIMAVIRGTSAEKRAELNEISPGGAGQNLPLFQQRNWHLAYAVYEFVAGRDGLPGLNNKQLSETANTHIPARMEALHIRGKALILDGAHNPQKLSALSNSLRYEYPNQEVACLISFVRSKETRIHDNLIALLPVTSRLIITSFQDPETDHFSTEPELIAKQAKLLGYDEYEVVSDPKDALETLLKRPESVLLITGSFFLLQQLRPSIVKSK